MSLDDVDTLEEENDNIDHTYLTFQVDAGEYAVPVANVTEIVRLQKAYSVPDVPPYIRGVINLRGKVIPLLDVRMRFGLADAPYTDRTVVVVLEVAEQFTGLLVDAVSEVADLPPDQIEPNVGSGAAGASMVRAVGKRAERVNFILDVERLVNAKRPTEAPAAASPAPTAAVPAH
jgi:purine-binding chemotaxis protein CheW